MVFIIVRNPVTKLALHKAKLSFTKRGIINQVIVAVIEDVHVVAAITKDMETMNGTNLEWQKRPIPVELTVLNKFG